MTKKDYSHLIISFIFILTAAASAFSQVKDSIDIPKLLNEVKIRSDENRRKVNAETINHTYKARRILREVDKKSQIKETSQLYEMYFPVKCPVKKCRIVYVLLEKDGKPLSADKIEKSRAAASERIQDWEADKKARELAAEPPPTKLVWMKFGYYVRQPDSKIYKTVVWLDGQEILEKCEFFAPTRETINGREAIGLSFRPRADAVFPRETEYMPQAEGKIWIDAADKVLIQTAVWPKGTNFKETTSNYLLEHAALALDLTRTAEGVWFDRFGRINALAYPKLFAEMKSDYILENFDYHRFNTEIENVEIDEPGKKN